MIIASLEWYKCYEHTHTDWQAAAEADSDIERGFPSSALPKLPPSLAYPKARIIEGLKLVVRTITQRRRNTNAFSPMESSASTELYAYVRWPARYSRRTLRLLNG